MYEYLPGFQNFSVVGRTVSEVKQSSFFLFPGFFPQQVRTGIIVVGWGGGGGRRGLCTIFTVP